MPSNSLQQKRIDANAHVLFEQAKKNDRVAADLEVLRALTEVPTEVLATLQVLAEEGDLSNISDVVHAYVKIAESNIEVKTAEIVTAVELTEAMRTKIKRKLEQDFKTQIYMIEKVDPALIGGFVLTVGDVHRDVSVRTQLEVARTTLNATTRAGGEN